MTLVEYYVNPETGSVSNNKSDALDQVNVLVFIAILVVLSVTVFKRK